MILSVHRLATCLTFLSLLIFYIIGGRGYFMPRLTVCANATAEPPRHLRRLENKPDYSRSVRAACSEVFMSDLFFELITPEGHKYKLWGDGTSKGFPEGTLMINHFLPLYYAGKIDLPSSDIADKHS